MPNGKKIALVICYFGELPDYFSYFIHSCRYNPSIDFFIITDNASCDVPLPGNVKFIYQTLPQLSRIVTEKLGFTVNIKYGYKCCDLKPAYGFIFEDLLVDYDFWGHSDIDVIYGNIRTFMTDELLDNYELISVRPDWVPGCFLLFKNEPKMNQLFKQSKDYQQVFTSDIHYCFDETNFAHDAFAAGLNYLQVPTEIESMIHVIQKKQAEGGLRAHFDLMIIEGTPGYLKWNKGTLTYRNRFEVLLYHLIFFKKKYDFKRSTMPIADSFSISPSKITRCKSPKPVTI